MAKFRTHYDNLKVARDAPIEVIRAAYRSLSQKYHPDKNMDDPRSAEIMSIINASYKVLSDPEKRKEHDAWIAGMERDGKTASESVRSAYSAASSASVPKPPPRKGPAAPAGRAAANNATVLSYLARYWFFYFLLILVLVAYIGIKKNREEPVFEPQGRLTPSEPRYVRPPVAENGAAWPKVSGHIQGYQTRHTDGSSQVTVDNGNTNSDMLVKIFRLDEPGEKAVRVLFVRAGDRYTVKGIRNGKYDVRYRNLSTGDCFRSEPFALEEKPEGDGVKGGAVDLYLYRGNQKTYRIGENDFADDLH